MAMRELCDGAIEAVGRLAGVGQAKKQAILEDKIVGHTTLTALASLTTARIASSSSPNATLDLAQSSYRTGIGLHSQCRILT